MYEEDLENMFPKEARETKENMEENQEEHEPEEGQEGTDNVCNMFSPTDIDPTGGSTRFGRV